MSIGVGYTLPFELIGAPWIDAEALADKLNARKVPGVVFRPIFFKPYYSNFNGEQCQGVQIHLLDYKQAHLSDLQFIIVEALMELYPEKNVFQQCNQKRLSMFDKVCGTSAIREKFSRSYRWEDIRDYWYKDVEAYREASKPYYLY